MDETDHSANIPPFIQKVFARIDREGATFFLYSLTIEHALVYDDVPYRGHVAETNQTPESAMPGFFVSI